MTHREYIGQQIAALRNKQGLTTRQLADMCGVTYVNISKIENGRYNVSIDILSKICSAMGAKIKIETMKTLEELRDYINSHEEWDLIANKIIELNGWTDETGDEYGICNDGSRRLYLTFSDGELVADIKDM